MNKNSKSIVRIVLVSIILGLLSGCVNNYQVTNSFKIEDTKSIEFTEGKFKKIVDRNDDIKAIQVLLNKLHSEIVLDDVELRGWKYEFKVINENEEIISKIAIYKDHLSYNNKIYRYYYQDKLYNKLNKLYEKLDYDEILEKEIEESIEIGKKSREELPISEAIKGFWLKDNQEEFSLTSEHLIQGTYKFQYKIKETGSNYIYLTAFEEAKSSSKKKELFELYLEVDSTRCNMRLKKIVNQLWSSPLVYEENAIYINDDNHMLGSFDSSFFND